MSFVDEAPALTGSASCKLGSVLPTCLGLVLGHAVSIYGSSFSHGLLAIHDRHSHLVFRRVGDLQLQSCRNCAGACKTGWAGLFCEQCSPGDEHRAIHL